MKAVKYLLYGAGGAVALALVAAAAAVLVVDGAFVKARLEQAMKARNRTLAIEGEPKLRLFPVAGIALGKTALSEPGSDRTFIALDSAEVAVRTLPLLQGEVALETLRVSGLKANIVRRKDGSMNFADLADEKAREDRGRPEAPPRLRIAGIEIQKAQLNYRDEASGQELNVTDLSLKTGRLDGQTPGEVALAARITGKRPEVDLSAQSSGALRFDPGKAEFAFDKFIARLKGRIDRDTLAAEFSAPKVEITPARASGAEVKGSVQVKGPQRNVDARLRIAAVEGSATALSIPSVALDVVAASAGLQVKAKLDASIKANLGKQNLLAEVSGRLDDSTLKAKLELTNFATPALEFEAAIDRLNLDRYQAKQDKADDRIDLSGLKGKTVKGKLAVGALTAKRVKLDNLRAEVRLAGGKLEVAPHSAGLYGGKLAGALTAEAEGNRIHVRETAQNVALGALLRDAVQKDVLEGRGDVSLDVQTAGGTVAALKKALAGSARIEMKDGAIKGINLADSARNLKSALGGKVSKPDPGQKTDFSAMSASFRIKSGIARNDDLKAQSPFLRLGGAGDLDIGNNTIDYLAKVILVATSRGQGGREAGNVAGVTIPVKLGGALDNPSWSVDYSGLAGLAGGAVGSVGEAARKGAGSITDKVRGLFGR